MPSKPGHPSDSEKGKNLSNTFDALLVVAFGGPEKREDVIPFLENVLRGRNVPEARKLEVAEHYYRFDGRSPLNHCTRALIAALEVELKKNRIELPLYWGNRNWKPFLNETIRQMAHDGVRNALALVLSAYGSYSGCRQYLENIETACHEVGSSAPAIVKLRLFYNHPGFVLANADRLQTAMNELSSKTATAPFVAFTAHSIPKSMANSCDYERQLHETCRLVSEELEIPESRWELVYQSRSGRPQDPWLEPDICDFIRSKKKEKLESLIAMPIGFLSDHLEVLYDLDEEARLTAENRGISFIRSRTVGTHPEFVKLLVELIRERLDETFPKRSIGNNGPHHDTCPNDCCPAPGKRP